MNELEVVKTVEAYLHDVKRSKVRDVVDNLYKLYKDNNVRLDKANNEIGYREHLIGKKDNTIEVLQAKIADLEDTNNTLNIENNTLNIENDKVNIENDTLSKLLETSKRNYTELLSARSILQTAYDDCLAKNHTQNRLIKDLQEKVAKLHSVISDNQKDVAKLKHNASCSERKHIFYKVAFLATLSVLLATIVLSLS